MTVATSSSLYVLVFSVHLGFLVNVRLSNVYLRISSHNVGTEVAKRRNVQQEAPALLDDARKSDSYGAKAAHPSTGEN